MCFSPDIPNPEPIEVETEESAEDITIGSDVPTGARESARDSLGRNRQAGTAQQTAR